MQCSIWELLNLKPDTVLDIPSLLYRTYGISQSALAAAMRGYLIQTVGKDYLEKKFNIEKPVQFFVGTTKHYSWPKGAGECDEDRTIRSSLSNSNRRDRLCTDN